jgi:hypothetical protein
MPMGTRPSHRPPRTASPKPAGFGRRSDYFDHFKQIAATAAMLDRLPGAVAGRPLYRDAQDFVASAEHPADDLLRAYDGLDPLTQRAFEAVVAGLDRLAESASDLCDQSHKPLTPVEIDACAAIGKSMRRLLHRAAALMEASDRQDARGGGAGAGDSSQERRENKN